MSEDRYHCGMLQNFNAIHRHLFGLFYKTVRTDPVELATLKELAARGTLVYVMKNRGQLEYGFFNHLFLSEGIPLARFANGCRTTFWRPFKEMMAALFENGPLPDPIQSGYLENLVAGGESALLNLKVSAEFLFRSTEDPLEFIPPLIRAAAKSEKPVFLITQHFLYERRPETQYWSLVDFLFGEKSSPGPIRKLILFLLTFRRRASVKFGEPFDLKRLIAENPGDDSVTLAAKLNDILLKRLSIERKIITGPTLKAPDKLLAKMFQDPSFNESLAVLSRETGKSAAQLEKKVAHYFHEIAATVNYNYIDFYNLMLKWVFNNVYDGVDIDFEGLARIKAVAGKSPIVLVPPHKSHLDYLLIPYIFYNHDIAYPLSCAGINLKFWGAEKLLRSGGGFFIRRTLGGEKLYRLVLEQYIKMLVNEGYSIEFFIEGTRSRTGKMLKPKMGMLSMFIQAWTQGAAPDILFVPISVNYERIFEEKSYMEEIKGASKKKENVTGMLKASQKFRLKYGKIFIRYAEPISLSEYMASHGVTQQGQPAGTLRDEITDFAYELTYHINRISVVTSTSLAAMSLLSFPRKGISHAEAVERARALERYLEFKGASLSDIIREQGEWAYAEALHKLAQSRTILSHHDFQGNFYTVEEPKRMLLDYHKNNSLHFFVSLACFSKVLQTIGSPRISFADLAIKYSRVKSLLDSEFTFSERADLEVHLQKLIAFYCGEGLMVYDKANGLLEFGPALAHPDFKLYASLLDNFFESLYVTLLCLSHFPDIKMEKKKLELFILEKGKGPYLKGDLHSPEALSRFNVTNSLLTWSKLGLILPDEKGFYLKTAEKREMTIWQTFIGELLSASGKAVPMTMDFSPIQEELH